MTYTAHMSVKGSTYHRDGVAITKEEFEAALMSMAKKQPKQKAESAVPAPGTATKT